MSEFQQQKRAQSQEGDSQNFFAGGSEHRYMTHSGQAKSGGSLPRPILECNVLSLTFSGQLISGPPREKKAPKDMAQAVFDAAKQ